jgi:RimJ/RimL family protein N-acetyltransferase
LSDTFIDLPEEIGGSRITLRRPHPGDGASLWEALNEPCSSPWTPRQRAGTSAAFAEAATLRALVAFLARRQIYYNLWRNADHFFLGQAGFDEIDWQAGSAHLGYWLRPSVSRQGLMTQALGLLCGLAFETLSLSRMMIIIDHRNERSLALARRLHFLEQGELVGSPDADGQRRCALVFALSSNEYGERATDFRALVE